MSNQPHNDYQLPTEDPKSYGVFYPEDDIVAVIEDRAEAERAVEALRAAGIAMADTDLATGAQVLAYEQHFQQNQTPMERLAQFVSSVFSDDGRYQQEYVEAARAGHYLLVVHAPGTEVVALARPILAAHHAHHARHYRRGTVMDL